MIRIHKALNEIPLSLDERKTETRRNSCIRDKKYHQKKEFHQRYKQIDIKESLKKVYHQKCAFCEQEVIECQDNNLEDCSSTIEHYRPKSIYYWLAYSWDNLLWCCHRCNQNKGNNFDVKNSLGTFEKITFVKKIHHTSKIYNRIEQPLLIHPEYESVIESLSFHDGIIDSNDIRTKYTINTCQLNRDDLNEKRKTILDTFVRNVNAKIAQGEPISNILTNLLEDIKKEEKEFIALRYWILRNYKSLIEVE